MEQLTARQADRKRAGREPLNETATRKETNRDRAAERCMNEPLQKTATSQAEISACYR